MRNWNTLSESALSFIHLKNRAPLTRRDVSSDVCAKQKSEKIHNSTQQMLKQGKKHGGHAPGAGAVRPEGQAEKAHPGTGPRRAAARGGRATELSQGKAQNPRTRVLAQLSWVLLRSHRSKADYVASGRNESAWGIWTSGRGEEQGENHPRTWSAAWD